MKTYSELIQLHSFEDRFKYLSLKGTVSSETFGFDRYLNQKFYKSKEWNDIRNRIIIRDNGCDMGLENYPIFGKIIIHHMNPISINDIKNDINSILNPEYLICVSLNTHNYIHYGDDSILDRYKVIERTVGDTILWKSK